MKAILRRTYGPAEALEFGDVEQPAIKPGEPAEGAQPPEEDAAAPLTARSAG